MQFSKTKMFLLLVPIQLGSISVTKAPTFNEVFQWSPTDVDSIRKKQVDATMAMDMIQKEIATWSVGLKKPCKSATNTFPFFEIHGQKHKVVQTSRTTPKWHQIKNAYLISSAGPCNDRNRLKSA